jgi:hypothetical protein
LQQLLPFCYKSLLSLFIGFARHRLYFHPGGAEGPSHPHRSSPTRSAQTGSRLPDGSLNALVLAGGHPIALIAPRKDSRRRLHSSPKGIGLNLWIPPPIFVSSSGSCRYAHLDIKQAFRG